MKRGVLTSLVVVALVMVTGVTAVAQQREATTNFRTIVIEPFDDPELAWVAHEGTSQERSGRWVVRPSKFSAEDYPVFQSVPTFPDALHPVVPDDADYRSLGVQGAFDRQGYNFLEIFPAEEDQEGNQVASGIPIPGRVQSIDMWVWGSNYDYYLELHLMDHRGIAHTLQLGDIDFRGWRNLRVNVPSHIPQEVQYVPQLKGLELTKIVLWTRPEEVVSGFYVYFDNIQVLTDVFEDPFDGRDLSNPDRLDEIWGGDSGNSSGGQ